MRCLVMISHAIVSPVFPLRTMAIKLQWTSYSVSYFVFACVMMKNDNVTVTECKTVTENGVIQHLAQLSSCAMLNRLSVATYETFCKRSSVVRFRSVEVL